MKKYILLPAILLITVCLNAIDNSLTLNQYAKYGRVVEPAFNYNASLIPRVLIMGDNTEMFLSAAFSAGYDDNAYFVHEVLRTDFTMFFENAKLTAGRMEYSAPFDYLASSLFDGVQFTYNTGSGAFSAGAWYTGFLYKRNANIIMTTEDYISYVEAVDYKRFSESYFASRRIVGALSWEHPAVSQTIRIKTAVIAQIDFNGREDSFNSQYVTVKAGLPVGSVLLEASGAFQLAQTKDGTRAAVAAQAGVFWILSSAFPSSFSASAFFSSGDAESGLGAFAPINAKSFGAVLDILHSGFSAFSFGYTVRLHKTFSMNINSMLILRSLSGTYTNYINGTAENGNYFLGSEFYVLLVWSPASDIQFNLGSGIGLFNPEMAEARWHVKLSMTRALY